MQTKSFALALFAFLGFVTPFALNPAHAGPRDVGIPMITVVTLETNYGTVKIELDYAKAPVTVTNFLAYVNQGLYLETIFHRVIKDFVIQGGGCDQYFNPIKEFPPIVNESRNGLKNDRGTISMARYSEPDTATSSFFINLVNNDHLNYIDEDHQGYAVFGRVVFGMDVIDRIALVPTHSVPSQGMDDVPIDPVRVTGVKVETN
jgi:cyclophilin family peptidyl-prolyl cis-trans isomerase